MPYLIVIKMDYNSTSCNLRVGVSLASCCMIFSALPTCHIFHYNNADVAALGIFHHLNVAGAVKETPDFVIVYIVLDVG